MGRPAKSVALADGARAAEDVFERKRIEEELVGGGEIACPDWLSEEQRRLFLAIVEHYREAGILSALDESSLAQYCVAVIRVQEIEILVNANRNLLFDSKLMTTRKNYMDTMWRGCSEFCLSPQARAKIGSLSVAKSKEEADPLLEALR